MKSFRNKKLLIAVSTIILSIGFSNLTWADIKTYYNAAAVAITGGSISGTSISGSTGSFTTLTASGTLSFPTVENAITCHSGGGQGSATALNASATFHRVTTVAASGDSCVLPAAVAGAIHCIRNDSSSGNALQLFGVSPDTINAIATGTGIGISNGVGVCLMSTVSGAWTTLANATAISGTGNGVRSASPVLTTPNIGAAIGTSFTASLNGNATEDMVLIRNTDATASGAGQARISFGNNSSAFAGTLGINATTHATKPGWFELLSQSTSPLVLGVNGNDIVAVTTTGIGNAVNSNNLLMGMGAPTTSSGFGTSPSIVSNNGSTTFRLNVGTGGTANGGVVGLPTATTGWNCNIDVLNPTATNLLSKTVTTSSNTTTVTVSNELLSTGSATAWPASTVLMFNCFAY